MAAIQSLLNPIPEPPGAQMLQLPSPPPSAHTRERSPPNYPRKKQKLCKDAAVFIKGNIHGKCRYPAYEDPDGVLAAQHRAHKIHPLGKIMEYPRHVPYNSEKKSFLEKTHRDGFEVFQYEFKACGEEKVYTMMWDYNIGLVRTTPLFKCMGYSKTTPAKMLNRNPGLREICHSITGGALVAQGYWMPFEAARAVAATFCWKIRYALIPVFGPEFPNICLSPGADGFGAMVIDRSITQHCTVQADRYRQLETDASSGRMCTARSRPLTPDSPTMPQHVQRLRPKTRRLAESASGYSSDSSHVEGSYTSASTSPMLSPCKTWTAANTPRSGGPGVGNHLSCGREMLSGILAQASKADDTADTNHDSDDSSRTSKTSSTTSLLLKSRQNSDDEQEECEDDLGSSFGSSRAKPGHGPLRPRDQLAIHPISDEKAAYLLLKLSMDASLSEIPRAEKRRASA